MLSEDEKKAIKLLQINPSTIGDLDKELLLKLFEFKEDCSIQVFKNWAYTIILKLVARLQKEIKEKNKQIDSMADYILLFKAEKEHSDMPDEYSPYKKAFSSHEEIIKYFKT